MRKLLLAACWFAAVLGLRAETATSAATPTRPIPAVEHVVIIIVDGLRPDVLLLADAPTLRGMIHRGAYSLWARTTDLAVTLPSCTSMLTGVSPEKHGVIWNTDLPVFQHKYPNVPTVLEMATRAGYATAMVAGKSKFTALCKPGTVTHVSVPTAARISDEEVGSTAVELVLHDHAALMCIHFADVDFIGHAKGWGSPEQLAQVAKTDAQVARVLAALDRAGLSRSTVVLVTADHGGAGTKHGADDMRSRHIPWIITGPGVKPGYDLTLDSNRQVITEDTCATACWLLGLEQQPYFDGKPVTAAFAP